MKNPLKHQSAPVASRQPGRHQITFQQQQHHRHPPSPSLDTASKRGHSHHSSFGSIFQSLAFRKRPDTQSSHQETADNFHIVHLPDRPIEPIRQSQVPSEENCRLILEELHHSISRATPEANAGGQKAPVSSARQSAPSSLDDRLLPPLPRPLATKPRSPKHQQLRPPLPLSERPLLALVRHSPARSSPSAPSARLPSSTEPRRFHMHGQTYDKAMAPLKSKAEADAARAQRKSPADGPDRPSSRSSARARIGPMTEAETARTDDGQALGQDDDETELDVGKYISVGYEPVQKKDAKGSAGRQPKPTRVCLDVNCKGVLCRVCTPMVRRYLTPEQQAAEEKERRQLQSKSLQMRRPELWSPKFSSPLRQSHPASPHPDSGEVSPVTPPPRSPVDGDHSGLQDTLAGPAGPAPPGFEHSDNLENFENLEPEEPEDPEDPKDPLLEWDLKVIRASRRKASAELYENDEPLLGYNLDVFRAIEGWGGVPDEPLLEWDIETIKALRLLPPSAKKKCGVVAIDTVSPKRPQVITTSSSHHHHHAGPDDEALAAAQYNEHDEYMGDYATSWPESSYYFGDRDKMPAAGAPGPRDAVF